MKLAALLIALFSFLSSALAEPVNGIPPESARPETFEIPGIALAEGISQITGTAISPMLGVSSVGAWKYYRTPEADRHRLPWFCHPAVWSAGFVLLGLCLLKDVAGTAAPSLLKKPLDFAELFEDKLSAIVASTAFVPIIAAELVKHSQSSGTDPSAALLPGLQFAAMPFLTGAPSFVATSLVVAVAVAAFFLVWMSCHAINVLIALSPFTLIDAALKLVKAGLLSLVTASAFVSPWIGVAICFGIVLVAGLIAPWAFRFTLFGTVFATDFFRFRFFRRAAQPDLAEPRAFTARKIGGLPVRTLGRLRLGEDGQIVFRYRPWIVLPARTVILPPGTMALSKGVLCPVILHSEAIGARSRTILLLLPRYCSSEAAVAEHLGLSDVRDGGVLKGFKAVSRWMADMLGFGGRNGEARILIAEKVPS